MRHNSYEAREASNSSLLFFIFLVVMREGLAPILWAAPKSPGPKDFRVLVGAQAGVLGQN